MYILTFLFSGYVFATGAIFCNDCTDAQLSNEMKKYSPDDTGIYYYYGIDLVNASVAEYSVEVVDLNLQAYSGESLIGKIVQRHSAAPAHVRNAVTAASNEVVARINTGYTIPRGVLVRQTGSFRSQATQIEYDGSASGFVDKFWYADAVNDYLATEHPFTFYGSSFISTVGGVINGALAGIEIKIVFPDNSSAVLVAPKVSSHALRFSYKEGSAKDVDGMPFLREPSDYDNREFRHTTQEAYRDFVERIQSQGVIYIAPVNGGGGGSGCRRIATTVCERRVDESVCWSSIGCY